MSRDALSELSTGFRERYLDYAELTAQLEAWAKAFPEFVRLESIGRSEGGRELWLLTLGLEPERARPAVWVDANMHATELAGCHAALAIAEDVIRLHAEPSAELHDLPEHVLAALREVLFYVLPRISPDGAETVLKHHRIVRSVLRDSRVDRNAPRWTSVDVNDDGVVLSMRQPHPTGEFVESREVPGLLVLREPEDRGPFYRLYPEGVIDNFDGVTIPAPGFIGENPIDLNRNFPYAWRPEFDQEGAGPFPLSEAESRAVVERSSGLPQVFAWLNFHTFGGVFIRPLGDKPDVEMDPEDLAVYRQIEAWGERLTGYPMVSGFEEFTYKPNKPLHGDSVEYAYYQRGCVSYVCELWDVFRRAGLERQKPFVRHYTHLAREQIEGIARWDIAENQGRTMTPWVPFQHPQLGEVEIGGLDPRFGFWNPPPERLAEICSAQSAMFLRVAALAPRITLSVEARALNDDLHQIDVTVENQGYLPSYILASARKLDWNEPLYAEIRVDGGELARGHPPRRELGHLDGWGRGLYTGQGTPWFQRSRGNTATRHLSWLVRGSGTVRVRAGACRVGFVTRELSVG